MKQFPAFHYIFFANSFAIAKKDAVSIGARVFAVIKNIRHKKLLASRTSATSFSELFSIILIISVLLPTI
ncbi:hypothetical protein A0O34_15880 [Chryseobacterium glaciei]|uniref:Uncharacterized protein n=1 Tax=Chryseobacterium glaciei TaxID=1685010 RepID=A0A172XY30_9FLAO|nr:hypothetical protein A0O34_15880 [Chryseobacterium glaciei]